MLEVVCRGNIAGPYKYLIGPQRLKFGLYFKYPLVEIDLLCCTPSELPSFACSFSVSFASGIVVIFAGICLLFKVLIQLLLEYSYKGSVFGFGLV